MSNIGRSSACRSQCPYLRLCLAAAAQAFASAAAMDALLPHLADRLPAIVGTSIHRTCLARHASNAPLWDLHPTCSDAPQRHLARHLVPRTLLRDDGLPAQHIVHRVSDIAMH